MLVKNGIKYSSLTQPGQASNPKQHTTHKQRRAQGLPGLGKHEIYTKKKICFNMSISVVVHILYYI